MNGEIKFRVWDRSHSKWMTNQFLDQGGGLWDYLDGEPEFIRIEGTNEAYFDIEQFTGLKDSKGVEIYEGDILEWSLGYHEYLKIDQYHRTEVKWSKSKVSEGGHGESSDSIHVGFRFDCYYGPPKSARVVGNIHEHLHLIKS